MSDILVVMLQIQQLPYEVLENFLRLPHNVLVKILLMVTDPLYLESKRYIFLGTHGIGKIHAQGFENLNKDVLTKAVKLGLGFHDAAMSVFYQQHQFVIGSINNNHLHKTSNLLPIIKYRPDLRNVRFHVVLKDWYRPTGGHGQQILTVQDLLAYNPDAFSLHRLTSFAGCTNIEDLNIVIMAKCMFDPTRHVRLLRDLRFQIKAGKVRIRFSLFYGKDRLGSVRNIFQVTQTEDDGVVFPPYQKPEFNMARPGALQAIAQAALRADMKRYILLNL